MGLCKCPKRKTTSHFCFHHCVNVCEYCIINNHTTCVVKSYTTWLKEANGSSISSSVSSSALCAVCQKQFLSPNEFENKMTNYNDSILDSKTAVRLLCYHIIHARCLSVYVKNQFKENKSLKCPSCAWPLWVQQPNILSNSNDTTELDLNELSPVALQLYKHLLDHGEWWGQALITNTNVNNIEKHLIENEDSYENTIYEESQQESQFTLEIKPQINYNVSDNTSLASAQFIPNSENSLSNYKDSELVHGESNLTMNHRNNTLQTHQRHFNNYDLDPVIMRQQQSFISTSQKSDLSNEYLIKSPLLLNNDNSLNYNGKYKPKYKSNDHSWTSSYQRLIKYICGTNAEDNTLKRTKIIIICLLLLGIVLLMIITSYVHSNNEPFENNNIDYAGENDNQNVFDSSKSNFKSNIL